MTKTRSSGVVTTHHLSPRNNFEAEPCTTREICRDRAVGLRGTENAAYIASSY